MKARSIQRAAEWQNLRWGRWITRTGEESRHRSNLSSGEMTTGRNKFQASGCQPACLSSEGGAFNPCVTVSMYKQTFTQSVYPVVSSPLNCASVLSLLFLILVPSANSTVRPLSLFSILLLFFLNVHINQYSGSDRISSCRCLHRMATFESQLACCVCLLACLRACVRACLPYLSFS